LLNASDVVLDAGAGLGWLTRFLAEKCRWVVAVEKDSQVALVLRDQVKAKSNVTVIEGDVLKAKLPPFNKVVAAPPYYLSSNLVLWLIEQKIECAILIVQKEFADRLAAPVGTEEYSWLSVVATYALDIKLLDLVPKEMFFPQPEVDSIIIALKPWSTKPFEVKNLAAFIQLTKWLFSQRNKKTSKALSSFLKSSCKITETEAEKLVQSLPFRDYRPRQLNPANFGELANALPN
jgi:16S rRNA (adenine1518-N6/adenine1519-N6)-dimethyltransferase